MIYEKVISREVRWFSLQDELVKKICICFIKFQFFEISFEFSLKLENYISKKKSFN